MVTLTGPGVSQPMHVDITQFLIREESVKPAHDAPVEIRVILVFLREDHIEVSPDKPRSSPGSMNIMEIR